MKTNKLAAAFVVLAFGFAGVLPLFSQTKGLSSISAEDMKFHLRFLGAREFEGRNVPSVGLNVASKYIALVAEKCGLKPLLSGNSYFQELPLEVSTLSPSRSYLRLATETGEQTFQFPEAFGLNMRMAAPGTVSGEPVFLGYGLHAPESNWDDYGEIDVKGKIVVILDADLPRDHVLKPAQNRISLMLRARAAKERGAFGVISVIGQEREKNLAARGLNFDRSERVKFLDVDLDQQMISSPAAAGAPFLQVDVRPDVAAVILGTSRDDLDKMFEAISGGKPVARRELPGKAMEIKIALDKRRDVTENVVGYIEGTDSRLSNEYIVIGSHHDHIGKREGRIYPGADDNASGAVAMFELARALKAEPPKRSVIFVWHTAEEKGLVGASFFLAHCPVPVERISANLNLDMITRNDPKAIYLIGSNKLSTELDGSIRAMNDRSVHLKLDYAFQEPNHPDRFFFRGDQFPYIQYGIPGVWFFCGTTEDYHQETDQVEKCDFEKMEKVTRLAYLVAWDIGNKPSLLKLDINPEITTRGKQNLKFNWLKTSSSTAIRNVRLFDREKVLERATVIFKGGKIQTAGPGVPIPEGAEVIDVHVTNFKRALEAVRAGADGLAHVFADELPEDGIGSLVQKSHFSLIPTLSVIKGLCGVLQDEAFLKDKFLEPFYGPADLARLKQTFPSSLTALYKYAIAEEALK